MGDVPKEEDNRPAGPARRRRVDEIFGEVLPETTSDDRDPERRTPYSDSWYLENRPPHHDR
jgi:hypothetical protein